MLLSFCLIFCQFQPGIAYKSVSYKKRRVTGWHLLEHDIILDFVLALVVLAMTLIRRSHILNYCLFLQKFLLKAQSYELVVGNCDSSIYC